MDILGSQSYAHAMVVHFPIALLFTSVFCELLALHPRLRPHLRPVALVTLILGAAGAALAVATGPDNTARGVSAIFPLHETLAKVSLAYFSLLAVLRLALLFLKRPLSGLQLGVYLVLAAVGLGLLGYTAHLGGRMVYAEAIGVQRDGKLVVQPAPRRFGERRGGQPPATAP